MQAGRLRHQVTIQQRSTAIGATGQGADTWITFAGGIWASVEPVSARELFEGQQVTGQITHRIRLRHLAGVTGEMRVSFGGRIFALAAPPRSTEERGFDLEFLATEIVP